jgi:hypothetical protein
VLLRLCTGAAPLTAAGEAAGRGEEAGRPPPAPVLCCGWEEKRMKALGFQGSSALLYWTDLGGGDLSR